MVLHGLMQGISKGVEKTLDQVMNYGAAPQYSNTFDYSHNLQSMLSGSSKYRALIDRSNAASNPKEAPAGPGPPPAARRGAAATRVSDLHPQPEAAAKQPSGSAALDWSRGNSNIFAEGIRKAALHGGASANLKSTLDMPRAVEELIVSHQANLIDINRLIEARVEAAELRLTKSVRSVLCKIRKEISNEVEGLIEVALKSEMQQIKSKALIQNDQDKSYAIENKIDEHVQEQEEPQIDGIANLTALLEYGSEMEIFMPPTIEKQISSRSLVLYSLPVLKVATDNFAIKNKVGEGGSSIVYKGALKGGKNIVVKKFHPEGSELFWNEVNVQGPCEHRNIMRLYGYCTEDNENKAQKSWHLFGTRKERVDALVFKYMEKGALSDLLFRDKFPLNWPTRFNIVVGIARGLVYLHYECHPHAIVHCDIKASNILLEGPYFHPKIADFGIAKLLTDQVSTGTSHIRGTPGYIDPEYVNCGKLSLMVDVYSFGVVLLEIVSGRSCRSTSRNQPELLISWAKKLFAEKGLVCREVIEKIKDPQLMENSYPTSEISRVVHVAFLCVQRDSTCRPTMQEALSMILNKMELKPISVEERSAPFHLTSTLDDDDLSSANSYITCQTKGTTFVNQPDH